MNKEIIYLVGHQGPEHNHVRYVATTYETALELWNKVRYELLEDCYKMLDWHEEEYPEDEPEVYNREIKHLKCNDPEEIDNYPQSTPYIREMEKQ